MFSLRWTILEIGNQVNNKLIRQQQVFLVSQTGKYINLITKSILFEVI
jgi:hypothetical protein